MDRGEGGIKSVLIVAILVLLAVLWIAQMCFWAAQTFAPAPKPIHVALEKECRS